MTAPFERTTCACKDCVDCCKSQPGSLIPGDMERIAEHLGLSMRVTALKFWASPGALLMNTATGSTFRVGTITPRKVHGKCIFLDDDDRCTIHAVAPAGCSYFDTHQSREEGMPISKWVVGLQAQPEYQSLRRTLVKATSYNPRWV